MSGLAQPDILECRVLWQRHSDSVDELRVPVTRVGLFKLAVKRLPAPRRYVGITALKCALLKVVWEVGLSRRLRRGCGGETPLGTLHLRSRCRIMCAVLKG